MKAKYIFRGFGLGVIITAIVMGAYTRNAVADARVNVLKEYGIGEEAALAETLVDVARNDDNDVQENVPADTLEVVPFEPEPTVQENEPDEGNALQTDVVPDAVVNPEDTAQDNVVDEEVAQEPGNVIVIEPSDEMEANEPADTVTIVISKGDSSIIVARKLHSAGLVDNAAEFDAFLMQHGYDKKMNTGTKVLSVNDSWQEMADKLSR